jgi:threonine/homoserine/homoserine lactone efflux protein
VNVRRTSMCTNAQHLKGYAMLAHLFSSAQIGIFLAAALILALTPGPGIMYVMARTLSGGARDGMASTLGTALGGLIHVAVAAAGLSALLAASARAFLAVKYVGAIYLVFLGIRAILTAGRKSNIPTTRTHGGRRVFLEGVLTEALNVKTALFFLAFIPQFVDHDLSLAAQFAVLGLVCVSFNTAVDVLVVLLASRLSGYFRASPRPARYMTYGSGTVLLGLGAYVALSES